MIDSRIWICIIKISIKYSMAESQVKVVVSKIGLSRLVPERTKSSLTLLYNSHGGQQVAAQLCFHMLPILSVRVNFVYSGAGL